MADGEEVLETDLPPEIIASDAPLSAGDAASLSAAIARLARDASLRRALGERARVAACERFDPDRFAERLIGVYEHVVRTQAPVEVTHA